MPPKQKKPAASKLGEGKLLNWSRELKSWIRIPQVGRGGKWRDFGPWRALLGRAYGSGRKRTMGGATSGTLLHYLSTSTSKEILAHLCDNPCSAKVWRDGLMHLERMAICPDKKRNRQETPGGEEETGGKDELALFRKEAAKDEGRRKEKKRKEKSKTPNREKDDKEKKKKKKRSRTPSRESGERKEKKSKKDGNKKEIKVKAKKELSQVLGQTGLDPSPEVRQVLLKRARRLIEGKKKKEDKKKRSKSKKGSSGSEEGSDSSLSSTSEAGEDLALDREELFQATSSVRKIAAQVPGGMCSSWIRDCQDYLLNSQAQVWGHTVGEVQPLSMQYFRTSPHGSRVSHRGLHGKISFYKPGRQRQQIWECKGRRALWRHQAECATQLRP